MSDKNCDTTSSIDVNDAFDSIAFVEENLASSGFKEGFEKGKSLGEFEGYHLGYHRGAEIGAEIGFYKGFLEAFVNTVDVAVLSQHSRLVEKLNRLIQLFPKCNDESSDIISLRDQIRSTYKRLCSLLKTDPQSLDDSRLAF